MARLAGLGPTITDGNLGIQGVDGAGSRVIVGVCSVGTVNQLVALADIDEVRPKRGYGPLANHTADQLAFGGGIVYTIRAAGDVAGTITADVGNPVAPAVTITGTTLIAAAIVVEITKAGALGTGNFRYSLDDGDNFSDPIALSATYVIPDSGMTLEFAVGAYVLSSKYKFAVIAPKASVSSIQAAIRAAFADQTIIYEYIHVAQPSDAAMWTALAALRIEAYNQGRDVDLSAETVAPGADADAWVAASLLEKAAFQDVGVYLIAPHAEVVDTLTGRQEIQSLAGRILGRISGLPVHIKAAQVDLGALPGVVVVAPFIMNTNGKKVSSYNNGHALQLENAGFTTVMRHLGSEAYFVSEDRTAAPNTSDFKIIPNRRVVLKVNTLLRQAWLPFVQRAANPEDLNASLASMVKAGKRILRGMQTDTEIVRGEVQIVPGQDLLSTSRVKLKVRVVPNGYTKYIDWDLGLENPLSA
jgi:hypothetical protein